MTADMQRLALWDIPKDVLPLVQEQRVWYKNKDKQKITRDLVVLKAKNAGAMLKKSWKLIGKATLKQSKQLKMSRFGRWNFGRDIITERSRGGLRAFRYRSGMRDLRYETEFRRRELRVPDRSRKRHRWMHYRNKPARWVGGGRYKK